MKQRPLLFRTASIFCILCALCSLFLLAGCDNENVGSDVTDTNTSTTADETTETAAPENDTDEVILVKDGRSDLKLVRCYGAQKLRDGVISIQKKIKQFTNVEIPIVDFDEITESDFCIVVGRDENFPETQSLLDKNGYGTYGFYYQNNRLFILGATDELNEKALNKFLTALNASVTADKDMILKINEIESEFVFGNWLENVPHPTMEIDEVIDCNDSTFMLLKRVASQSMFDSYIEQLKKTDYQQVQQNEIKNMRFVTYQNSDGQIMVSFDAYSKNMKIICERFSITSAIPNVKPETGYTKLTENKLSVLSLNYAASCTVTNAGGLSLVFTLEDGRYVIVDGGYKADSSGLYNYLVDNNVRTDGVTIAAWILTHDHYDHIGAFRQFVEQYGKKVTCEYLISNTVPASYETSKEGATANISDMSRYASKFINKAKIIKPHAGQKIYFCNVEFEMLYTHEELYPRRAAWINETSLAFHVKVGDNKILVTGDAELQAIDKMILMYGEALKSDVLQLPHHGYTNIQQAFFDYVSPKCLIWPSNEATKALRVANSWHNGLYQKLIDRCDACYVADGEVEILTLPYRFGDQLQSYTMDFQTRR